MTVSDVHEALRNVLEAAAATANLPLRYENVGGDPPDVPLWVDETWLGGPLEPAAVGAGAPWRHTGVYGCRIHAARTAGQVRAAYAFGEAFLAGLRAAPVVASGRVVRLERAELGAPFYDDVSLVVPVTVQYSVDLGG